MFPNPQQTNELTQQYSQNPFSPPAYGGVGVRNVDYTELSFDVVTDISIGLSVTANNQSISVEKDADFEWRAIVIAIATGAFEIKFYDSQGYPLSNVKMHSANFTTSGGSAVPYPLTPAVIIPAGGAVTYDMTNLYAGTNSIELILRGVKRYKLR